MSVQLPLNIRIQDEMTFENYFTGKNTTIVTYLKTIASGREQYAYIWGNPGVGCSHLLQAICNEAWERGYTTSYLPLAHHPEWPPSLLENLESLQVVCLDDIDLVAGKQKWEEALMHLYNQLRDCARGFVIAGTSPPNELPIQLADLKSRLTWGTVFCVSPLSDAEKIEALKLRAEKRGFSLPTEVAQFLLRRVSRNTSELFETLNQLDEASLGAKRRVTIPFVKEILGV